MKKQVEFIGDDDEHDLTHGKIYDVWCESDGCLTVLDDLKTAVVVPITDFREVE